jgi:predicted nucleic acid-binding protein
MIVVDTNVVAYFVIPGSSTEDAEIVRAKDREWVSPGLIRYELLNVAVQQVSRQRLSRDQALRVFHRGLALVRIIVAPSDPLHILNLHQSSGCSSYDLEFVWLAMSLRVPLVTSDDQVLKGFPSVAMHPRSFGALKS